MKTLIYANQGDKIRLVYSEDSDDKVDVEIIYISKILIDRENKKR